MWPHPTPRDHDFHNFESTLPEDASTQVSAFLADYFLRRRILKIYSIYSYVKLRPPIVPHPTPRDHDFHNFESTLPEDASTQISAVLAD